jgi:hypothetical protein
VWFEGLERLEEEELYVGRRVLDVDIESCIVVYIKFM